MREYNDGGESFWWVGQRMFDKQTARIPLLHSAQHLTPGRAMRELKRHYLRLFPAVRIEQRVACPDMKDAVNVGPCGVTHEVWKEMTGHVPKEWGSPEMQSDPITWGKHDGIWYACRTIPPEQLIPPEPELQYEQGRRGRPLPLRSFLHGPRVIPRE